MRYLTADTAILIGKGAEAKNVEISVWDETELVVDAVACTEIVAGIYTYDYAPGVAGTFYWAMSGPAFTGVEGTIVFGGYPDTIIDDLDDPDQYKATGFAEANEYDAALAAIQADLDDPSQYKASVSGLAPENEYDAALAAIQGDLDDPNQYKAAGFAVPSEYDAELAAIAAALSDTNQYKADVSGLAPASEYDVELAALAPASEYDAELAAIQADLDDAAQYKATGFAVPSEYDAELTAIQADLDDVAQYKADVTNLDALVSSRATPDDIQDFTITKLAAGERNLQLITKSVSRYYRGQTATLVAMTTFAGSPTSVDLEATVYYPDDSVFKDAVTMDALGSTGIYTYEFAIPSDAPIGVYKVLYEATKSVAADETTDIFTNDDNWTIESGTWNVVSGVMELTSTSTAYLRWTDVLSRAWIDYTVEVDVTLPDTNGGGGICGRYKSSSQHYRLWLIPSQDKIYLSRGSTTLYSESMTVDVDTEYTLKMQFIGGRILCSVDDDLKFEYYDETYAEGTIALHGQVVTGGYTAYYDNVVITVPAHEYQEFSVSDFQVEEEIATVVWDYER